MTLAIQIGHAMLGLILLAQGGGKWMDLAGYIDGLHAFELVPEVLVPVLAVLWATAEVVGGALLVAAAFRRLPAGALTLGVAIAMAIAVAYTVMNGVTWARGIPVGNCTCFGVFFPQRLGLSVMIQDVAVVAWCAWLWAGRQVLVASPG